MNKYFKLAVAAASVLMTALWLQTASANMSDTKTDPENTLVMETTMGTVIIELLPDVAPEHANRLKTLAREGFYDGIKFHRVIPGFMAQTGDPLTKTEESFRWGTGGSELPNLKQEFSDVPFERGTVGMARSQHPDSANSQFFINFKATPFLDGQYTVFGRVVEGMKIVDRLATGEPPSSPDEIVSMRVQADL